MVGLYEIGKGLRARVAVSVEPVMSNSLLEVLASLSPLEEEFPEIPDTSPRKVEL